MTARKVASGQNQEGSSEGSPQARSETGTQGSDEGSKESALTFVYSDVVARIIDVPGQGSRIFQPGDTIDSNIDPRYFKEATE
jgi:hypothetical protein